MRVKLQQARVRMGAGQSAAKARRKSPTDASAGISWSFASPGLQEQQELRIRATKKTHGGDRLFLTARFLTSLIRLKPK